jgi:hypothetical protein
LTKREPAPARGKRVERALHPLPARTPVADFIRIRSNQPHGNNMPDNQTIIRNAYNRAEVKDIPGWINAFTTDG